MFRIAIKDLLLGLVDGFEHLDFTKNLVLFLFTFQVKAANLCNNSNDAAFSRFHRKAVNNSSSLILCLILIFTSTAAFAEEMTEADSPENKKKIVILATGGTIAGVGDAGKEDGYKPGSLSVDDLLSEIPGLADLAEYEAIQICNVNSDDITDEIWIQLANTINEMAADPEVDGFVITHGTDTMEETAYFLNLTVKTDKPVVLTGSMRPSTSISADGPMNLYEAVCVATSDEAAGKGVLVVFSDRIIGARSVSKTSTYSVMAISAGETGDLGIIRDGILYLYDDPIKKHTTESEFDITGLTTLPKVSILYFCVDANPDLLRYAAENSDGLVIAGAGEGSFSDSWIEIIKELEIPVVISSRINDGVITKESLLCDNTVSSNNLSPQKSSILLRLALTTGDTGPERLEEIYSAY